jgi:NADH dehydrogenase
MATIGRSRAIAEIGKLKLTGFAAWWAWLVVHLVFLVGFRNRIGVFFDWIYSYFTYSRGVRLITGCRYVAPQSEDIETVEQEPVEARSGAAGAD